jgi:hypothetical protein
LSNRKTLEMLRKQLPVVREYVGYDRLSGSEEQALLAAIYAPLVPLLNFFMPTRKLKSKTRIGSKEIKVYDEPRSPFARLLESAELPHERKDSLSVQCAALPHVKILPWCSPETLSRGFRISE